MRAAIYARVSSDKQREARTIESQLPACRTFADRNGWTVVDTFADDGISGAGTLADRPGMLRLLDGAAAHAFDVVVVYDMDRLTRSESQRVRGLVLGSLQESGIKIASVTKGTLLDLDTDEGDLMSGLDTYFAASWLRKHKQRVAAGAQRAIDEGRKPRGVTPYGLRYDAKAKVLEIDEATAPIVREIFARVGAGESCDQIAFDLTERRIPWKGKVADWPRDRVWFLVTRPTYRGQLMVNRAKRQSIRVPAIVEDDVWQRAQESLTRFKLRGLRRTKHVYLVEKIGRCALCGAPICISAASARGHRPAYYACHARFRAKRGSVPCSLPMLRVDEVDRRVWTALRDLLLTPGALEAAVEQKRAATAADDGWRSDLAEANARLDAGETANRKLLDRFQRGLIDEAALDHALERWQRQKRMYKATVDACERHAAQVGRQDEAAAAVLATVETLRARVDEATAEQKRDLVAALVSGVGDEVITIGPSTIEVSATLPTVEAVSPVMASACRRLRERNIGFTVAVQVVA